MSTSAEKFFGRSVGQPELSAYSTVEKLPVPPQDIQAQGKCQGQRSAETRCTACSQAIESSHF